MSAGKDDYAVSLFRQAADADAGQTEMFYWTSVGKATEAAPRLAQELAVCYRDKRNYDKASATFCNNTSADCAKSVIGHSRSPKKRKVKVFILKCI